MKILIFTVNYKADDKLMNFIDSVNSANKLTDNEINIVVLDNSQKTEKELTYLKKALDKRFTNISIISDGKNYGYFGGLKFAQNIVDETYDIVIYCNPDIELDKLFFVELKNETTNAEIIAPSIILKSSHFDQNPKYITRLSKLKLNLLKIVFSNIIMFYIYNFFFNIKEYLSSKNIDKKFQSQKIYAPHGAIFIFKNISFFKSLPEYPIFLFGEEIFIAEEARKRNIDIVYLPNIKVYDERHASISLLSCNNLRRLYYESIDYILKEYY